MMETTDYDLVKECLEGNKESFAELVIRYKKLVYTVVYKYVKDREEVNDISQEVFIRIYKSLHTYNPEYKFSTWSVKITSNLCMDVLRKKRVQTVPFDDIQNISRQSDTPENKFLKKEKTAQIRAAISELPEKYKQLLIMYHQKGMAYSEMADTLGEPLTIIKNRLYRSRLVLRESLSALKG